MNEKINKKTMKGKPSAAKKKKTVLTKEQMQQRWSGWIKGGWLADILWCAIAFGCLIGNDKLLSLIFIGAVLLMNLILLFAWIVDILRNEANRQEKFLLAKDPETGKTNYEQIKQGLKEIDAKKKNNNKNKGGNK